MSSSMSSVGPWKSSIKPITPERQGDPQASLASLSRQWFRIPLLNLLGTILIGSTSVFVHDIPDERVDRGLQIFLDPPNLRVVYEVSLTEWTLYQDLKRLAPELAPGERFDRIERYARYVAPLNARGLLASVDGNEISWQVAEPEVDLQEHPRLRFHFHSSIPLCGNLRLQETNYSSSYGTSRLALQTSPTTWMSGYEGPTDLAEVPELPIWALSDEEERRTRELAIDYRAEISQASRLTSQAPSVSKSTSTRSPANEQTPPWNKRLTQLFWDSSGRASPLVFVIAFVLGVVHAFQPGHGKSVVIGASIQGPRTLGRGLLLAGTAAIIHLVVATSLALVAVIFVPLGFEQIHSGLTRSVGLSLAIMGAWRMGTTCNTIPSGSEPERRQFCSSRDAILAGAAIGAIPCWDAVMLLAIAWVAGKAMMGITLLLAFSLGASATILGVALTAGLFRGLALGLGQSPLIDRSLGAVGGLMLAGIGAFLFFFD